MKTLHTLPPVAAVYDRRLIPTNSAGIDRRYNGMNFLQAVKIPFCAVVIAFTGCSTAQLPDRPMVSVPQAFKETTPTATQQPTQLENWWIVFEDPTLNQLEEDAIKGNYDLKQAALRVDEARTLARITKSDFYPHLDLNPSASRSKLSANRPNPLPFPQGSFTTDSFKTPFDLSYEVDVWGRVRKSFEASVAEAHAQAAIHRTVLLTLTSDVAKNYFRIRSLDSEIVLLKQTIALRKEAVEIATSRYKAQLAPYSDVSQAETELATIEAQLPDLMRKRSEIEHLLAVLNGKAPSEFSVAASPLDILPPQIPAGLPSELLQRRPDMMEANDLVKAAGLRIGVAQAAFLPAIHLTGSAGFESVELTDLFTWPSKVWSIGPSISLPIFSGGKNEANLEAAKNRYEQATLQFRQRALVAFREVEDALVNLRLRDEQSQAQARAVLASRETTIIANSRYKSGLANYMEVVQAEQTQLESERMATQILGERLAQTVQLIRALGGGWETNMSAE